MKFDDLDKRMRVFEEAGDISIIPGLFVVVRLDGRSFTKLTRETKKYDAPFDEDFHGAMISTTEHCMKMGFRTVLGYTQSDEISILLHSDDNSFERKTRKIISIFSGEASGYFSLKVGVPAAFDSRICQLPSQEIIIDYFRWRSEDANRNALNSYCYWTLRKEGLTVKSATEQLKELSTSEKNQLLFERQINYNNVPSWQKRGTCLYFGSTSKVGINRLTGESVSTSRRVIKSNSEIPLGKAFNEWVSGLLPRI